MDLLAKDMGSQVPISPPLSRPDIPRPGSKPPHATDHRALQQIWDIPDDSAESHNSSSASPSTAGLEIPKDDGACERMIEKWRLIKVADKQRARKKVYRTDDEFIPALGKNYSKFYEAFQQGISTPQVREIVTTTVPAKRRSSAPLKQALKRRRQDPSVSPMQADEHQALTTPAPRSVPITTEASMGAKPSEIVSPLSKVRESSVRPRPRSDSAGKATSAKRRGVGLYAGNWEYVTDEEKVPEYLSVAEKTADLEGRTTRRQYAQLTSRGSAGDSGEVRSQFESQVRKSGRARIPINYARFPTSEDITLDAATPEQIQQNDVSPAQETAQTSASASVTSMSNHSTLMPDDQSRSTSTSTATRTEQQERPDSSWNAIVYEVLALADGPLTFGQLTQQIRSRFPFFKSPSQEKVLKSGLKNPLYFHEAFIKGEVIDGKQTWGLKPGRFIDKKTGELLTPPPRNPICPPRISTQAHEEEDPNPIELTSKVSHSHRPRSSNPRFGREILNSPEIPDSQEVIPNTSTPRGGNSHLAAEHATHHEEPTGAHGKVNTAKSSPATSSPKSDVSVRTPQPRSQWVTKFGSPSRTSSSSRISAVGGAEDPNIRKFLGPIDREAIAKAVQHGTSDPAAQSRARSIPSSVDEIGSHSNPRTSQDRSPPDSVTLGVSFRDTAAPSVHGAAPSPVPYFDPGTQTPSVTSLPGSQLDDLLPDGKAGIKENRFVFAPRWG